MRVEKKFIAFVVCVIIISILLFANISNASQFLKLEHSWSSQTAKELVIGLKATNIKQERDRIIADVVLWNNTLTWVYLVQDFNPSKRSQFPVQTEGAHLLGPLYTKKLGTIEFSKGSFLQFNAKTATGVGHLLGSSESNMLLGALAIDLAMRGFFSKELPPNAFDRPLVFPIEAGMASIDPLFFMITSHCSGPLGAFSRAVVMKDTDKAFGALGRFLVCTTESPIREKIKEWLTKLFSKEIAEKWAKRFIGSIGDFLNLPMKAALMKILTEYTLAAPPESWARIETVEVETVAQPQITRSLSITPNKDKYQVGDILTADFNITNKGNAPITLDVLTVGGRVNDICPQDKCPDFTWKENITLQANEVYRYEGKLKLEAPGNYHFFTAYRTTDGWNTSIPTAQGILNTIDIKVVPQQDLSCPQGVEYPDMAHHKNAFGKAGLRGYCTWYAAERWLWDRDEIEMVDYVGFKPKTRIWDEKEELPSTGPAYRWAEDAKKKGLYVDSKKPVKDSIVVFGTTSNNSGGHVAYVESVDEKEATFTISQMNAGSRIDPKTLKTECFNKITMDAVKIGKDSYKGMKILGFIYPPNYPAGSTHIISGKYVPADKDKLFLARNWRDWVLEFREDGTFSWKWSLGGRWEIEGNWIEFAFYPPPKEDEDIKRLFLKTEVRLMRNLTALINGVSLKEFKGVIPFQFEKINILTKQKDTQLIKKTPQGSLWDKYIALKSGGPEVVTLDIRRDKTFWLSANSTSKWEGEIGGLEVKEIKGRRVISAYYRYPNRGDHFTWRFLIKDDNTILEENEGITFVKLH